MSDNVAERIGAEAEEWLRAGAPQGPGPVIIDDQGTRWVRGPEGRFIALRKASPATYRVEANVELGNWGAAFWAALPRVLPLMVLMGLLIFWSWSGR